jgi:hypothetical protein
MEVTQDIILQYLKLNSIGRSKSSTEQEIYMIEFLINKGLMSPLGNGNATINNEGKDFINSANYFNPVPLKKKEWMDNIIDQLKDGKTMLNGYGKLFDSALDELQQDGILEQVGKSYYKSLTTKGRQYLNSGLSYNEFLNINNRVASINTTGNVFNNSPINHSRLDANINLPSNSHNATNNQTKGNTSRLEKLYWISGIVIMIIAVYEFYLKYHLMWL